MSQMTRIFLQRARSSLSRMTCPDGTAREAYTLSVSFFFYCLALSLYLIMKTVVSRYCVPVHIEPLPLMLLRRLRCFPSRSY